VSYQIRLFSDGKWVVRAEGQAADRLINGLSAVQVLKLLDDGTPIHGVDLRAIVEETGEIRRLCASEIAAIAAGGGKEGRRIVPARICPASAVPTAVELH
jgi:hypothetical protein